ncbi:phosphoribosylglycinamide formyltransferase [Oceanicola granulosus HTCC2516]|uniref:Phosphoribosylglycinamide formyltransferase n=1 Tax=Oceanicola granulosus (strain ATCC BAA-861 / DSM 15982 / KCTC 12143 / HTCC2516) TaxID=314256 RepID=Q2CDC4_OCEGH|nr:phosphoribosylglycinamide formyltransferase [Oceanicola granulosus]EAR50666.1 phosphoribosylglycinamide formyltransferase [Oceanicola granulosus HTCC2516]
MSAAVAVLISGTGSNMLALLDAMAADGFARPVLVLSNRPDAAGLAKAAARGVATAVVDHRDFRGDRAGFDAAIDAELTRAGAEIVCLAGFMRILGADFVTARAGRMLNIHPSLLPKYPGLDTHARALAAGDVVHGCTVHEVTPELDAGPMVGQARCAVLPGDTPDLLAARVHGLEHQLYPAALRRFVAGEREPVLLEG